MSLSIVNWNIDENHVWFVRLSDTGSKISVELYLTADDAQARTNRQASGESDGYGVGLEVTLVNDQGTVSFFQEGCEWHVTVSGQNGDETKIFKVKEFVELDEIAHPIYRTGELITARALSEINAHTHAKIIRSLGLGIHVPDLEAGQILRLQSTRRDLDETGQVFEHRIIGTTESLISEVEAVSFLGLKR